MNIRDVSWLVVRIFGVWLFCLTIFQLYDLIERLFDIADLFHYDEDSNEYNFYESESSNVTYRAWKSFFKLNFLSALTYYFLIKGQWIFNKLQSKNESEN